MNVNVTVALEMLPHVSVRSQVGAGSSLNPVHPPFHWRLGSQSSTMCESAKTKFDLPMPQEIEKTSAKASSVNERQALGSMGVSSERKRKRTLTAGPVACTTHMRRAVDEVPYHNDTARGPSRHPRHQERDGTASVLEFRQ